MGEFEVAEAATELGRDKGVKVSGALVEESLEAEPEVFKTAREGMAVGVRDGGKEGGEVRAGTGGAEVALSPGDEVVRVVGSAGGVGWRGGGSEAEMLGIEGGTGGDVGVHSSVHRAGEKANVHEVEDSAGGARVGKGGGHGGDKAGSVSLRSEPGRGIGACGGGGTKDIVGPRNGAGADAISRDKSRRDMGREGGRREGRRKGSGGSVKTTEEAGEKGSEGEGRGRCGGRGSDISKVVEVSVKGGKGGGEEEGIVGADPDKVRVEAGAVEVGYVAVDRRGGGGAEGAGTIEGRLGRGRGDRDRGGRLGIELEFIEKCILRTVIDPTSVGGGGVEEEAMSRGVCGKEKREGGVEGGR